MQIKHVIKDLYEQSGRNTSAVTRYLNLNRATVDKHKYTDKVIVLDDGRVFIDSGKVVNSEDSL